MKNRLRKGVCLLILVLLIGTLTGCDALDELRAAQGFYTADGNIRWGGAVYKPLPPCNFLWGSPDEGEDGFFYTVNVTEEGAPVLASAFSGDSFTSYNDRVLLYSDSYYGINDLYFCREQEYEGLCARINAGLTPEVYGYDYCDYQLDEEGFVDEFLDRQYILTDAERAAVDRTLAETEPQTLLENIDFCFDWSVTLFQQSRDGLLGRYWIDLGVLTNGAPSGGPQYYLMATDNDQPRCLYTVPPEQNTALERVLDALIASEEALANSWSEEWDGENG